MPIYEGKLTRLRTYYVTSVGRIRIEADNVDEAWGKMFDLKSSAWKPEQESEDYEIEDNVTECTIDGKASGENWKGNYGRRHPRP